MQEDSKGNTQDVAAPGLTIHQPWTAKETRRASGGAGRGAAGLGRGRGVARQALEEAVPRAPVKPARGGGGAQRLGGWLCWLLAPEPSAMTSRHPHYCGHPHCRRHPPAWGGGGGIQNATSAHGVIPDGLISARYAVITKTPGWEVLTTTSDVNVKQGGGGGWVRERLGEIGWSGSWESVGGGA